jgi:hypothetical protein
MIEDKEIERGVRVVNELKKRVEVIRLRKQISKLWKIARKKLLE